MKMACVLNGFFPHHLDHLSALCFYCKCPLIVDDPDILALSKKYYPQINVFFIRIDVMMMAKEYDLLLFTATNPPLEMMATAKCMNITTLRFAYAPHGFSDKADYSKRLMNHEKQDIALIHGQEQLRQLKQYQIDKQVNGIIKIGNPREHFYKKHQEFFDSFLTKYKTSKKSILFAPTYNDGFSKSSFDQTEKIIKALEKKYQLIVKLHPLLKKQHLIEFIKIEHLIKNKSNVHLVIDEPIVHPFIKHCDAYLGDFSSIGYEFAQTGKSIFLFESKRKRLLDTFANIISCPTHLDQILSLKKSKKYNFNTVKDCIFENVDPHSIKDSLKKLI